MFASKSMQDSPIHTSLHAHTVKPEVIRFITTKKKYGGACHLMSDRQKGQDDRQKKQTHKTSRIQFIGN